MSASSTTPLSSFTPSFYAHSGKTPIAGTITTLGVGIFVGSVLAFIYSFLSLYIPIIGIVSILMLFGLVLGIGLTLAWMFRWAQIRSVMSAAVVSLIVALVTWYMSWVAWEIAILVREIGGDPNMLMLIIEPRLVYEIAADISRTGAWSIGSSGDPVSGVPLLIVWLIEALIVMVGIPKIALGKLKGMTFCESCLKWCDDRPGVTRFAATTDVETVRQQLHGGDLESIAKHELADPATPVHYRVDLTRCPACDASHLLTVSHVTIGADSKGNQTITAKPVVDRMYITSEWAQWIDDVASQPREREGEEQVEASDRPEEQPASMGSDTAAAKEVEEERREST